MYKEETLWLLLAFALFEQPGWSQGISEFGGTHAAAAGLGAGMAASMHHGKVVQRSYKAMLEAQRAAMVQSQVIEQYMKVGCQLESQKRWADAERSFRYALQMISRRDGPGSFKSVPTLEHLVSVSKAEKKLDQAISFQETALLLTKAQPTPNQQSVLNAQLNLGNLFVQKQDYSSAEPVFRDSVNLYNSQPSLPSQKRHAIYQTYAKVLRKLHKDTDADAIEAEADIATAQENPASTERKEIIPPQKNADSPSTPAQTAPGLNQETKREKD